MSRIKFIANLIGILLFLVSSVTQEAMAHVVSEADFSTFEYEYASEDVLEERISNLRSNIDLKYSGEVREHIRMYTKYYRTGSERLLGKLAIYFPIFEEELRKRNLPDELKYLAIIESNLKPEAVSHVGAVGLWQFMKGTAVGYDLVINGAVDERRDPRRSTTAAFDFLSDLYNQFGDWTLAIAAYNCGPGNVRKAIRRANSLDFWKIRPYLPKETRAYVPKFIAANYLINYYHAHNLKPRRASNELIYTTQTQVYDKIRFSEVSNMTGAEFKLIQRLNPAYLKNYIPRRSDGRFYLTLPTKYMNDYKLAAEEQDVDVELAQSAESELKARLLPKMDLDKIGNKPGDIPDPMPELQTEQSSLDVEKPQGDSNKFPNNAHRSATDEIVQSMKHKKIRFEYYKLSVNETLYDLADKRHDITVQELFDINQYSPDNLPSPGTIIKIRKL